MCCGLLKLKTFHCVGKREFGWEGELQVFLYGVENFFKEGCATLVYIHLTWRNCFLCHTFQIKTQRYSVFGELDQLLYYTDKTDILKLIFVMAGGKEDKKLVHWITPALGELGFIIRFCFCLIQMLALLTFKCVLSDMVPESTTISASTVLSFRKPARASLCMVKEAQK